MRPKKKALGWCALILCSPGEGVLSAVGQCGWALQYADAAMRAAKDIMLAAVAQKGSALKYADAALHAEEERDQQRQDAEERNRRAHGEHPLLRRLCRIAGLGAAADAPPSPCFCFEQK